MRKAIARVALATSVYTRQQFEHHQVDGIGSQRSDAETRVAAAFCISFSLSPQSGVLPAPALVSS